MSMYRPSFALALSSLFLGAFAGPSEALVLRSTQVRLGNRLSGQAAIKRAAAKRRNVRARSAK